MNFDIIRADLRAQLSQSRYDHTIRVHETAIMLAKKYDESIEKVAIAALLHDYAKCDSALSLKTQIRKYHLPTSLLSYHHELWHGPVGAEIAREKYGVTDEDVLRSIRYHTTGSASMSKLQLIIFIADYIEPARSFPGVDEVRHLAAEDLLLASRQITMQTMQYLMTQKATIHPDTLAAYNDLTTRLKE